MWLLWVMIVGDVLIVLCGVRIYQRHMNRIAVRRRCLKSKQVNEYLKWLEETWRE